MAQSILRIDASARTAGSYSRELTVRVVGRLALTDSTITIRDIGAKPPSIISEDWVNANFTPDADRSDAQKEVLAESDALIAELQAADMLVIGLPMYNFGVPAAFKAWIDQVARARKTFQYTASGPEGLLHGKRAYVLVT